MSTVLIICCTIAFCITCICFSIIEIKKAHFALLKEPTVIMYCPSCQKRRKRPPTHPEEADEGSATNE